MRKPLLLAGLIVGCASPGGASPPATPSFGSPVWFGPPGVSVPQRSDRAFTLLRSVIVGLRQEAIALQASDGGTLTAEHRDSIQTRIDAAYQQYYRSRTNRTR